MTLSAHYQMFGRYNAWANTRLFGAAAQLGSEQYRADRGAFFKSVHGTLNHLLATDRIWMQRFTGTGTAPDRLDAILFETLDELRPAREAEDRRIVDFVEGEGVPVRIYRTRRPGIVVYVDDFQIAAVPWRDTFVE